ncbi:MAG: hypothetical protein WC852_07450 [Candidatus Nanoarchaeia archaeon]|jgi:hypothetical protein
MSLDAMLIKKWGDYRRYYTTFPYPNEKIDAISAGMDISETDDVIAVCSSGDAAFAAVEHANSVLAVDNNKLQVEYAQERASLLAAGNIEGFLHLGDCTSGYSWIGKKKVVAYFSTERLEIKHVKDFMDEVKEGRFSKAYLSNIISYSKSRINVSERKAYVEKIASMLKNPGLVYITDGGAINTYECPAITADEALTEKARLLETKWRPVVIRRTA